MPHPTLLSLQLHRSVAIPGPLSPHPTNSPDLQPKSKTYDSRYSPLVTHESTSLPIRSLSSAERTGCSIFSTGSMAVCTRNGSVGCLCMLDFWTRGDRGASWDRWTRRWALRRGQRRRQVLCLSCPRHLRAIVLGYHGEPQPCLYWRAGLAAVELQTGVHRSASYEVGLWPKLSLCSKDLMKIYMSVEE